VNGKVFRYFRTKKGSKLARMYFRGVNLLYPCEEKYRVTQDCVIIRFPFTEMFEFASQSKSLIPSKTKEAHTFVDKAKMDANHLDDSNTLNMAKDIVSDV
jgi:hypothetical protein